MKCGRCGYEIERLRNDWWSQEISNSYRKGQIHSNGFFCFGVHDGLGGKYHRKWVECVVWLLVPPTGRNALYTVLAVVTKRSDGQKQEEALRLLFSSVLALPLMNECIFSCDKT